MSDKLKITLGIIGGVLVAVLLFCLVVVIACSVNGLTFGEQVCDWFSGGAVSQALEQAGNMPSTLPETPIA